MNSARNYDAVIIGSGMGGLACAAALAKSGHKVLVLEQHYAPGGLTQTFERNGFRWDVGVHYLGELGGRSSARQVLDWITNGAMEFASLGTIYDTFHFPDGFQVQFGRPEAALRQELKEKFPFSADEIDGFFVAMKHAEQAGKALFMERALPRTLSRLHNLLHEGDIRKWWGRTSAEVVEELVQDPRLRAVLLAQRGDYGGMRARSTSFGLHAMVMHHYVDGAYYPVGGAKAFSAALVPVIQAEGGEIRLRSKVSELLADDEGVSGVRLEDGSEIRAAAVISNAGALNTVALLPPELQERDWPRDVHSLAPSHGHVALYLGFEGDIGANGATASNQWFHESWDIDKSPWNALAEPAPPVLFVSFPSLKDPSYDPGPRQRHTAEIVAMTDWEAFAPWKNSRYRERPADYRLFKGAIERSLMAEFERRFPALAPMVVTSEVSTPLSTKSFIGSPQGAIYGLEVSSRRFLSPTLRPATPLAGLYLSGQDVATPGIAGAMMGGILAAAAIDPGVYAKLG